MKINYLFSLLFMAGLLSGCMGSGPSASVPSVQIPTPTLSSLFQKPDLNISTDEFFASTPDAADVSELAFNASSIETQTAKQALAAAASTIVTTQTITPTQEIPTTPNNELPPIVTTPIPDQSITLTSTIQPSTSTPEVISTLQQTGVITDTIYTGSVDRNWILQPSYGLNHRLQDESHTIQGRPSLGITASRAGSTLCFQVRPDATTKYLHNKILGVIFWMNSGNNTINPGDLSLTVTGSNKYPYYQFSDRSADEQPLFTRSGTRLYDLGLNHPIPPNTWVPIEIDLDSLVYDPGYQPTPIVDTDYIYVTGLCFIVEVNSLQSFYLSQIGLLSTP
jgi:hypothetical protein